MYRENEKMLRKTTRHQKKKDRALREKPQDRAPCLLNLPRALNFWLARLV